MSPLVVVYRIDARNRLSHVNPAWSDFARENRGEAVLPERIIGRDLLQAINDLTVRELYRRLIERARSGSPVRFRYRCDAPDRRRTFAMEIRALAEAEVEFVSTLLQEEMRPAVALLESERPRDERLLRVCSWCQKIALPDETWVTVENAVASLGLLEAKTLPGLTHGICPSCLERWSR